MVEKKFKEIGIPISQTSVDNQNFNDAINISMQALNAAFFKPNTILLTIDTGTEDFGLYDRVMRDVQTNGYGLVFFIPFGTASLAIQKNLCVWISELPDDWETSFNLGINDLAVLLSILIARNWDGHINVNISDTVNITTDKLERFNDMVRFPRRTELNLLPGDASQNISLLRNADLNVFSISREMAVRDMTRTVIGSRVSAIFCLDSGFENGLA
jgi:hypothetical protein